MVSRCRNVAFSVIVGVFGVLATACSDSGATDSGATDSGATDVAGVDGPRIVYHGDFAPSIPMSETGHIASYTLHLGADVKRYDAYLTLERRRPSTENADAVSRQTLCVASFETAGEGDPVRLSASYSSVSLGDLKETIANAIEEEFGVPSDGIPLPEEVGPSHRLFSVKIQFQETHGTGHQTLERSGSVVIKEPDEKGAMYHGSPAEFSAPWPNAVSDEHAAPGKTRGIPVHQWTRKLDRPGDSAMLVHQSLFGHRHATRIPSREDLEGKEFEWRVVLWLSPT